MKWTDTRTVDADLSDCLGQRWALGAVNTLTFPKNSLHQICILLVHSKWNLIKVVWHSNLQGGNQWSHNIVILFVAHWLPPCIMFSPPPVTRLSLSVSRTWPGLTSLSLTGPEPEWHLRHFAAPTPGAGSRSGQLSSGHGAGNKRRQLWSPSWSWWHLG